MTATIREVGVAPSKTSPVAPGAYDIVGDVHGCWDELAALLARAGWTVDPVPPEPLPFSARHPCGRLLVFVGDLTDRGPASDRVLGLALGMLAEGTALWLTGNHDWKLARYLRGNPVRVANGLRRTIEQIEGFPGALRERLRETLFALPHQARLEMPRHHPRAGDGALTAVHAAAPAHHQDRSTDNAFHRAVYGYPTGERSGGSGAPADRAVWADRADWAAAYRGPRWVVHGHEPHAEPRIGNRVMNLDTGCVFGGRLTLYRADSMEMLHETARADHSGKGRPLA